MPKTLVIVGLGLLGSSIAKAIEKLNLDFRVIGVSSPRTTTEALSQNLISKGFSYDDFSWVPQADLVLLCTPISHILQYISLLKNHKEVFKTGLCISDVGSTKSEISDLAHVELESYFCGGHPMAGSEKKGLSAADSTLFESTLWILTGPTYHPLLKSLIESLGARVCEMNPQEHDQSVAHVSHMPQLLSSALAASLEGTNQKHIDFAGPGFRDMSRLAESSYSMWQSIFETNRAPILEALTSFDKKWSQIKEAFADNKLSQVEESFLAGNETRSRLHNPSSEIAGLFQILVSVADKQGQINQIISSIHQENLDIRDIELMKNREGVGGTLRLAFGSLKQANKAVECLTLNKIKAYVR